MFQRIFPFIAVGFALALAYPPFPLFFLAFVAFLPLLKEIEANEKGIFLKIYTNFFIYHTLSLWWIGSFQKDTDPFLLISGISFCFLHPFLFMFPVWLMLRFKRKFGFNLALLLFPFVWTGFEWLHGQTEIGFPWLTIGYTQIHNRFWVQIADLVGVHGLSFFICLVNVLFYQLLQTKKKEKIQSFQDYFKSKEAKRLLASITFLVIIPMIYGAIRTGDFNHEKLMASNPTVRIGIVQPNINPWDKWSMSSTELLDKHLQLQSKLIDSLGSQDLVLWSETSMRYLSKEINSDVDFNFLKNYMAKVKSPFLTGFTYYKYYQPKEERSILAKKDMEGNDFIPLNSSVLVSFDSANFRVNTQTYTKMKLTPFGERIPFIEDLGFLKDHLTWGVGISGWGYGKVQNNLTLNGKYQFGNIICIESIHPDFIRKFAKNGAGFLTLITNDAWYDGTYGPLQHWLIAEMRAIENRRYIARCANSGVSGFITPLGTDLKRMPQYETILDSERIPVLNGAAFSTIYVRYGDFMAYLSLLVAGALLVLTFFKVTVKGKN